MAYRFRGRGQLTAPTSRTGRGFIFDNRRILIKGKNFQLTWNGPRIVSAILQAIEEGFRDISDDALKFMQNIVPVDTGATRDSCYVNISAEGTRIRIEIGATTTYTIYIELGTATHDAQPFIRPTFDYLMAQLPNLVRNEVRRRSVT